MDVEITNGILLDAARAAYEEQRKRVGRQHPEVLIGSWDEMAPADHETWCQSVQAALGVVKGAAEWRSIPVYVNDNDVVMCYADHDCDERSNPGWLPGRRVTLGAVVDAFVRHGREHANGS